MQTNFLLGTLRLTETARLALKRQPFDLVARHAINEHGEVTAKELEQNIQGMKSSGPILSRYKIDPTDPNSKHVLVITKNTWAETIISVE